MKIKRNINGSEVEIELTHEEVAEAYLEHEHFYDCESIRGDLNSGCYEEFEEMTDEEWEYAVHEIALESRRQQEEYGFDECEARTIARKKYIESHNPNSGLSAACLICMVPAADRTWTAEAMCEGNCLLTVEKEYPVEMYYARTDLNGSRVVESDVCSDRASLLESLNWLGACGFVPLQFWDFDINQVTDERIVKAFNDGLHRRYEAAREDMEEVFGCAEPLEEQIARCQSDEPKHGERMGEPER